MGRKLFGGGPFLCTRTTLAGHPHEEHSPRHLDVLREALQQKVGQLLKEMRRRRKKERKERKKNYRIMRTKRQIAQEFVTGE
jgi:hypothetical protein